MIFWITGQPGAGKTSIANKLWELSCKEYGTESIERIDGDDLRDLIQNKDYSKKGRLYNVDIAQKLSHYLHNSGKIVFVSLVSPYLKQREEFKKLLGDKILEIYVHAEEDRPRAEYKIKDYQKPISNYIDLNTTGKTVEESIEELKKQLNL